MKKVAWIVIIFVTISCRSLFNGNGDLSLGLQSSYFSGPAPYGMVLVKGGSIRLGTDDLNPLWGIPANAHWSSFEPFWIDQTEVTNARYREFIHWVRDSIIRERLYDPMYVGNDMYKIAEDRDGEPITPYLDWSRPIPWNRPDEDELSAIESIYSIHPVTGEKKLDKNQLHYRYEWYDYKGAAQSDVIHNPVRTITKDTAYFDTSGYPVNERITRAYSGPYDFLHTRIVNIHPDESCWLEDTGSSNGDLYTRLYLYHAGFNDYPVVGVTWDMANAYCAWRTHIYRTSLKVPSGAVVEAFRLPTEGEWEYAARSGRTENIYPWGKELIPPETPCLMANFKPGEGNYTEDGHLITSRVRSYPPNEFGVYDMAGNVAEWTSSTYHIRTNRKTTYGQAMVVKGGSWKDLPDFIRSDSRVFEYSDQARSYIGFRCVRSHVGFTGVKTRK